MNLPAQKVLAGAAVLIVLATIIAACSALYFASQYACIHYVALHVVGDDLLARTLWCRPAGGGR